MNAEDFVDLLTHARDVLVRKGISKRVICCGYVAAPGLEYEDDVLCITATTEACGKEKPGMLEIVNKARNNPVIMIDGSDNMFRFHGQFYEIEDHFFSL